MRELDGWPVAGRLVRDAIVGVLGVMAICVVLMAGSVPAFAATTVTAQGEWFDLRDHYTRADRESSVVVCWHSDTPVSHVGFEGEEVAVWETVLPGGTDGCSQPLEVDAPFMTQGAHAFHVAVKRNFQLLGQSEPWTVLVDRTPPGQASAFEGRADDALNVTVDWAPAVDPNLRDGSMGSGVASYSVRYRIGTGPWTTPIDTPFPTLEFQGAGPGQSVVVEVIARDHVGNVGVPATASLVLVRGALDPCAAPVPPECEDPPRGTPVDEEPDPALGLQGESLSAPEDARPEADATLLHLVGHSDLCLTNRCWTTIRNADQSWAMGMVRVEPPPGADPSLQLTSTIAATDSVSSKPGQVDWYFGGLSRMGLRCRWINAVAVGPPTAGQSDCPDVGPRTPFKDFQSKGFGGVRDRYLVRGNNCFKSDGSPITAGGATCNHGTPIHLKNAAIECADVGLNAVDGNTRETCTGENVILERVPAGTCVAWRYVTRDRDWVMVRHPGRPIERGGWVFIPIQAFERDRAKWPSYNADNSCG